MPKKRYVKSVSLINDFYLETKFLKVNLKELPLSVPWKEGLKFSYLKEDRLHKDMEDFLFKMFGKEFLLDMGVIREVLDSCEDDMQKNMENFLISQQWVF